MSVDLISHGSMVLVLVWLVLGGLGIPLPEDAALLATGVLVYHHRVPPAAALGLVVAAVLAGDVLLFRIAQRLGPAAYERPLFRRLLPPDRRRRIEAAYARQGGRIVFLARHVVGVRAATFALAGIHGMRLRRFVAWDAMAASISVPVVVGLGYVGAMHIDRVRAGLARFEHYLVLAVILVAVGYLVVREVRLRRVRPLL